MLTKSRLSPRQGAAPGAGAAAAAAAPAAAWVRCLVTYLPNLFSWRHRMSHGFPSPPSPPPKPRPPLPAIGGDRLPWLGTNLCTNWQLLVISPGLSILARIPCQTVVAVLCLPLCCRRAHSFSLFFLRPKRNILPGNLSSSIDNLSAGSLHYICEPILALCVTLLKTANADQLTDFRWCSSNQKIPHKDVAQHFQPPGDAVRKQKKILYRIFSVQYCLNFEKYYHTFGNMKLNDLDIFQSLKLRILMRKILPIFLKLNITPNTVSGLSMRISCSRREHTLNWESLRFSENSLNHCHYSTTEKNKWSYIDWNSVNFHRISETLTDRNLECTRFFIFTVYFMFGATLIWPLLIFFFFHLPHYLTISRKS